MSAEVEFCEFVAALVRLIRPQLVIETGVGQGFSTRRILAALSGHYVGYESDAGFREALKGLDVWGESAQIAEEAEPTPEVMARCDLAILDSGPRKRRVREINLWRAYAPSGSHIVVHDARPDHPRNGLHRRLAGELAGEGLFLPNPRGSWLHRKP
jgi:hypothetical protein